MLVFSCMKAKTPELSKLRGFWCNGSLAMTYFLTRDVQYHRRGFVSRSCSGREGVGPKRYGRQA